MIKSSYYCATNTGIADLTQELVYLGHTRDEAAKIAETVYREGLEEDYIPEEEDYIHYPEEEAGLWDAEDELIEAVVAYNRAVDAHSKAVDAYYEIVDNRLRNGEAMKAEETYKPKKAKKVYDDAVPCPFWIQSGDWD